MLYIFIPYVFGSVYTIPEYYGSFYLDFNASDPSAVTFYWSSGFHISSTLDLWIANPDVHTITLVEASSYTPPKATLIKVAGKSDSANYQDGDLSTSLLNTPRSIFEYNNKVYVADTQNHCIRIIDINVKSIKEYAGRCQEPGFKDGPSQYNRLNSPDLVGVGGGVLFINDSGNNYIRMVDLKTGYMTTLLGGACRDSVNITDIFNPPEYDVKNSVFFSENTNVHVIVCVTDMVNNGEPIEHNFNSADYQDPCSNHVTLCENRTSPYVIRNYLG